MTLRGVLGIFCNLVPPSSVTVAPSILEHAFRISNPSGDVISGDLRVPSGIRSAPGVVICHGFTAFKDWGPFPYFGRRFAEHGFVSVAFNFSHNGIGRDPKRFTEFEKFSLNTIGKELEDLHAVIGALRDGTIGDGVAEANRLGVVGHSRGAAVALLGAAEDENIRAVAAWGSVATVHRYTERQREAWERDGYLPVSVRSSHTRLRFDVKVLHDLEANRERYDLLRSMGRLRIPVLFVHGKADVSVRPEEPLRLYEASDKSRTDIILLERAGHTFGAKHPFRGEHPLVDHLIDLTAQWLSLHL